jgi:hypothetical protein
VNEATVAGILRALEAAGDGWPRVARGLDTAWWRRGRVQGLAWVRPAVCLAEEHDDYPNCPLVLLRVEDGSWFRKGTRQGEL